MKKIIYLIACMASAFALYGQDCSDSIGLSTAYEYRCVDTGVYGTATDTEGNTYTIWVSVWRDVKTEEGGCNTSEEGINCSEDPQPFTRRFQTGLATSSCGSIASILINSPSEDTKIIVNTETCPDE